jgi:tRNA A-37 threonylcarbamoyl transferase component Bud32
VSLENYGNYQLVKKLAMGGMAQIYLARRKGADASNELVVVKRILPHLAENLEFVRMFLDEARIAARLAHPNIVQIHDLGAQDDSFFLAMEYIHGEDLRRMSKRADAHGTPLPVELACRIISDACAGLDYAHKKTDPSGKPLGIVHRDVSPQNILVSFDGSVKVVDFGIAKAADQATVTRSGVLKGKYSYMSPEQAAGQRVDCRSDVFALGVVLYELITQTRLFKRSNDMQTLTAVAECQVTPPSYMSPRVPPELDAIVMKALAKEPSHRYSEALQLQVALEAWLRMHGYAASQADLSAFMREVYAERIAREARTGTVVVDDDPPVTGQRTALEGHRRAATKDVTKADRGDLGAAAAVEVTDRSPPRASKDVTKAERGELVPASAIVATERNPQRPSRALKAVEPRREEKAVEPRREEKAVEPRREEKAVEPPLDDLEQSLTERRPTPPRQVLAARRPEPEHRPPAQSDPELQSRTDMTMVPAPRRRTRRWITVFVATASAAMVAFLLGGYLGPRVAPGPATVLPEPAPPVAKAPPEPSVTEPPVAAKEPAPVVQPPPPAPAQVQLTLETEPAQAAIRVDGQERGQGPLVVAVKAEQELEVAVSAPQHRPISRKLKVGAGPAQRERFVLEPLPKPPPPTPVVVRQPRADPPPKPAPEPAKAMVRFAVTPWAEVSCGGRNLGTTPFEAVALPVGVYQCRFHNPDLGRTLTQRVEVKATGMNKVVVKF